MNPARVAALNAQLEEHFDQTSSDIYFSSRGKSNSCTYQELEELPDNSGVPFPKLDRKTGHDTTQEDRELEALIQALEENPVQGSQIHQSSRGTSRSQ